MLFSLDAVTCQVRLVLLFCLDAVICQVTLSLLSKCSYLSGSVSGIGCDIVFLFFMLIFNERIKPLCFLFLKSNQEETDILNGLICNDA